MGNIWKESCLDHIYTNDTTFMTNINTNSPLMGDHKILTATLGDTKPTPKITEKKIGKIIPNPYY